MVEPEIIREADFLIAGRDIQPRDLGGTLEQNKVMSRTINYKYRGHKWVFQSKCIIVVYLDNPLKWEIIKCRDPEDLEEWFTAEFGDGWYYDAIDIGKVVHFPEQARKKLIELRLKGYY